MPKKKKKKLSEAEQKAAVDAIQELVASASQRKAALEVKLKRHRIGPDSGPTPGLY